MNGLLKSKTTLKVPQSATPSADSTSVLVTVSPSAETPAFCPFYSTDVDTDDEDDELPIDDILSTMDEKQDLSVLESRGYRNIETETNSQSMRAQTIIGQCVSIKKV